MLSIGAPESPVDQRFIVTSTVMPGTAGEISATEGEIVTVTAFSSIHWWKVDINGRKGFVPSKCLRALNGENGERVRSVQNADAILNRKLTLFLVMTEKMGQSFRVYFDGSSLQSLQSQELRVS